MVRQQLRYIYLYRFFDLVRWGIAAETLNKFFVYDSTVTTDIVGGHSLMVRAITSRFHNARLT
jgi:hypothetical protein